MTIVVSGQDLARRRDFSAYCSLEIDKERVARIKRLFVWPHTDYSIVMADTRDFYKADGSRVHGLDIGNAGEPIMEQYRYMGLNVEPVNFTLAGKDEMVTYTRALRQRARNKTPPYVALPRSGKLVSELKTQIKEQERDITAARYPQYAHPQGRHDDLAWSFFIACLMARVYLTEGTFMVRMASHDRFVIPPSFQGNMRRPVVGP
jgi:hypothetical protein